MEDKQSMPDFLDRALKITSDLKGYADCFQYAVLYEGHKTVALQCGYLLELLENTIPELQELLKYMKAKDKKKEG